MNTGRRAGRASDGQACRRRSENLSQEATNSPTGRARRFEHYRIEAKLPLGKTLDNLDFRLPARTVRAARPRLCDGRRWIDHGHNIVILGPPDTGKSHLAAGPGLILVECGYRVFYARATAASVCISGADLCILRCEIYGPRSPR